MQTNKFLCLSSQRGNGSLEFLFAIFANLVAIAVFVGAYYYIETHGLFPDYLTYIYWGMKVLVGYNIIAASARSMVAPILAAAVGGGALYAITTYSFTLFTSITAWQLIIVGAIGLVINLVSNGNN